MNASEAPRTESTLSGRLAVWAATGLGVGLVSPAPGTVAGLWGLALVPAVHAVPSTAGQLACAAALAVVAAAVCGAAARALGAAGDPGAVTLDEIAALPIVFLGVPAITGPVLATGFLLFRVFDIAKPGAVGQLERLPGGWGIMADDVGAAILAWAALRAALWLDAAAGLGWLTQLAA